MLNLIRLLVSGILLLTLVNSIYAGFNGITHHSRANCATNNESISWDATRSWELTVNSSHLYNGEWEHTEGTPLVSTWRSAVVHWGEGKGGWKVKGYHYSSSDYGYVKLLEITEATDCSIYDGWWD